MFSHDITLNEFLCPIPICQPEADLGSILHIFHQTNCDFLAISGNDRTWGIISSGDILSLLAKHWQQLPIATAGYPKRIPPQHNSSGDTIRDFHSLIQPAIVYQADTPLQDFLKSLRDNYFPLDQSKYLIVDRVGKLRGKLDQDKLLKYVASESDKYSLKSKLPISSTPLLSLLDNLALPLKIETVRQENCYENRCWQKLISQNRDKYSVQSQELNISIANWWMRKQLDAVEQNSGEQNKQADREQVSTQKELCCLGDSYFSSNKPTIISPSVNLANLSYPDNCSNQENSESLTMPCFLNDSYGEAHSHPLGIQVEEGVEWNYIKIPLRLENEALSEINTAAYWLVLAIKTSLIHSSSQLEESPPLTVKSTVDRLLTTISHELKSPLTGIVGLSNLLSSQKIGDLNQRQTKYVQLIRNSGQKLMTIVNDLIELTSLTTGKFPLKSEEIVLQSLFQKLYQQIIVKFQATDSLQSDLLISTSKIQLDIKPGLEKAIADRLRLSSIMSHLMIETMQFSSSSIALKIEVKDCERGIAITVKNKVTKQVSSSTEHLNMSGEGIGLNLIIAKYLTQALQGDINSTYQNNSCSFTLLLPIIKPQPSNLTSISHDTKSDRHSPKKNLTILCLYPESEVIDPNIGNNNGLDFDLKKWAEQDWSSDDNQQPTYQHRIIEADGLEQAHTLARIWQLDVIVLDGYQVLNPYKYLRSLQESEYLSALPLIILDTKTAEAANQVEGLNVYPCLLPAQCRSIKDLMQVIQIATEQ